MKKFVKVFGKIYTIICAIVLLSFIFRRPLLSRNEAGIFCGFTLLELGVEGLFEKAIVLTKTRPFKYEEDSIVGRNINILLCVIGVIIMLDGLFEIITSK